MYKLVVLAAALAAVAAHDLPAADVKSTVLSSSVMPGSSYISSASPVVAGSGYISSATPAAYSSFGAYPQYVSQYVQPSQYSYAQAYPAYPAAYAAQQPFTGAYQYAAPSVMYQHNLQKAAYPFAHSYSTTA